MEKLNSFNDGGEFVTNESIHRGRELEKAKSIKIRERRLGNDALNNTKAEHEFDQIEFQLDRAKKLIHRYKEDYYVAGSEKNLEDGHLEIFNPTNIAVGFQAIEDRTFDKTIQTEHDRFLFNNATEKIAGNISRFENRGNLLALEHEAAMNAIMEGAYTEHDNPNEPIFNLPMNNAGLRNALEARGVDFTDPVVRQKSIDGFINIIEATRIRQEADVVDSEQHSATDLLSDRFKEANWYFDNFGYGQDKNTMSEFIGRINEYSETAKNSWPDTAKDFLATRPEYAEFIKEAESPSRRDLVLDAIGSAQEMTEAEFRAKLKEIGLEEVVANIFPDAGKGPERKRKHDARKPRDLIPGAIKRKVFMDNIELITDLRDDANVYLGGLKNGNRVDYYGVIRFGYRGHNVVIAESLTDTIGACYVWSGKTGEDREGWREPFSVSKAYAREQDSIRVFNHDQRRASEGEIITATTKTEAMWRRIWGYLNSLPAA